MRRHYRNRHSTFIKALLEQKNKKKEEEQNLKLKEEKKKQKVKEKALAHLNGGAVEPKNLNGNDTGLHDFSELEE